MEANRYTRLTIELHNDEADSMRELVRLAHERLANAPRIQMKGVPLHRQAGLVGPELFRVKQMIEKLGRELGIDCPADAAPDNDEPEAPHSVSLFISAYTPEAAADADAAALSSFFRDVLKHSGA